MAVSDDGQRLAIADTGHDQVVVCLLDGLVLSIHTGFNRPQGVRFDGDEVVVCDTGAERVVSTTGEVMADGLLSPWDLTADGGGWLVAEAGRHRIVRIRPWERQARPAAGSRTEGHLDGPWHKAQLSRPSGLARLERGVAFVDAGSGALRLLDERGDVLTIVGPGGGLEGPMGVATGDGSVAYVADTAESVLRVWEGGGLRTVPAQGLAQPGGLDVLAESRLVVADTGNGRVVFVDVGTGGVEQLALDESWVVSPDGPPLTAAPGLAVSVPFAVHLAGEDLDPSQGPPVKVTIEARPASLLARGPVTAERSGPLGSVEARAGQKGRGLLLVEAAARTRSVHGPDLRLFRRRHPFSVGEPARLPL